MSPAKKRPKKVAPTPQHFFESMCPRVLGAMRSLVQERGGRYALVVEGDGGGSWTLDFASASVDPGAERADVTVILDGPQFASLSTGKVELRKLVADGAARLEGNADQLENLSFILAFLERG